ncbi:H/ACA ribonucleoprotein complex subunit 3-like protein [Phalaenopsis equestris]|uniref:H/ACA ribonucleoprotein complex subunit 3-like protein n=1 Tax=Phalaenopsis equestris TaxID=78828 RepID=UPI0009E5C266|nr:H/ACA ribonucleoprotein complex subunit 3-like protein [Phalaenopsis equestris]
MYLQFYFNDNGDKVYTTKKESPLVIVTESAHPVRFSPGDKYSRQRVLLKKRFGLLPTQKPPLQYQGVFCFIDVFLPRLLLL